MEYQPIPEPGSDEFKSRIKTSYQKYVNSKAPNVENERIRPSEQEFFDWLLEDKELIYETDKAIREAGFEWCSEKEMTNQA
jgi:hypothetical protein